MAEVVLRDVHKIYDNGQRVVDGFNLEIADKEFVVFVGPSGCGKSTTLRMIAGLEEVTGGEILIDGKVVNNTPVKDRDIAMVFQSYALYPHMTVYENMAFSLKLKNVSKSEIARKVEETAKILGLTELLARKPKQLSGGQRQRVALGRAIIRNPKVFLLDEPLSNLDAKLRLQMRTELLKLHKSLGATFIYVTHDQVEAMTMADRIVIMKDGVIQQVATPIETYRNPNNIFVASFMGSPGINLLPATLGIEDAQPTVRLRDTVHTPVKLRQGMLLEGEALTGAKDIMLGIRPENIKLTTEGLAEYFMLSGTVELIEETGSEMLVYLQLATQSVTIKVSSHSRIVEGEKLKIFIDLNMMHLFDKQTERRITRAVAVTYEE